MNGLTKKLSVAIDTEHGVVGDDAGFKTELAHAPEEPVGLACHVKLAVSVDHDVDSHEIERHPAISHF